MGKNKKIWVKEREKRSRKREVKDVENWVCVLRFTPFVAWG